MIKSNFEGNMPFDSTKNFKYSITYTESTEESSEYGDYSDQGYEVERQEAEIGDILHQAHSNYGIYSPTSLGSWESTSPLMDRNHFEKGVDKYFQLHVMDVDGSPISEKEHDFITHLLSEGKYHADDFEEYGFGGLLKDSRWNRGLSYKLDRAKFNKNEKYEVPMSKRSFGEGGGVGNVKWKKTFDEDDVDKENAFYVAQYQGFEITLFENYNKSWGIVIEKDGKVVGRKPEWNWHLNDAKESAIEIADEIKNKLAVGGYIVTNKNDKYYNQKGVANSDVSIDKSGKKYVTLNFGEGKGIGTYSMDELKQTYADGGELLQEISTHKAIKKGDKIYIYIKGMEIRNAEDKEDAKRHPEWYKDELIDTIPAEDEDDLFSIFESLKEQNRINLAEANAEYKDGGGVSDDFKIGDKVEFSVPYFNSQLTYRGTIVNLENSYAVVKYENNKDILLETQVEYSRLKKTKMAKDGGGVDEKVYIKFMNKDKGFKRDMKEFDSYEEAIEWGKKNIDNFNTDMVNYKFKEGGSVFADMSEKEFLKEYFGVNTFTSNPSEYFDIKKMSSSSDSKIDAFIDDLKSNGYSIKKKSYSDFTSVMGVKKKSSFKEGGAVEQVVGTYSDFKNKVVITATKTKNDNSYQVIVKRYPSGENIVEYPRTMDSLVFVKNYIEAIGKYTDGEIGIGTFTEWIKQNGLDYNSLVSYAEKKNVIMPKYVDGGGVEKSYNNPEKSTHVLHIDGYNWYLEKIDGTHFYMSNSADFRGMAHHIGQHKGEPYYEEIRQWLADIKMSKGNPAYAKGGLTEHGLKEGDKIIFDHISDDNIDIVDNEGNKHIVDLEKGVRYAGGGSVDAYFNYEIIATNKMGEDFVVCRARAFGDVVHIIAGLERAVIDGESVKYSHKNISNKKYPKNYFNYEVLATNKMGEKFVVCEAKAFGDVVHIIAGLERAVIDGESVKYSHKRLENSKFEGGGSADDISYEEILDVLKESIDDSIEELPRKYEQSENFKGEEVESKSRDGFMAFTNGGYEATWFEYISQFSGSGNSLPTAQLDKEMQRQVDYQYENAKDRFKDEYPEIVEELGEENIDYNSLNEAGYESEAEQLSEWEMDFDGDDSIMCEIGAYYYDTENYRGIDGEHTIRLFGVVNLESPYHRRGNLEDSYDIDITFNSIEELKEKVAEGLKEIISWFDGKMYNDSKSELGIKRMAGGGSAGDISWNVTFYDKDNYETFEVNVRGYFENEEDAIKQAIYENNVFVDDTQQGKMYWGESEVEVYGAKRNYAGGGSAGEINIGDEIYLMEVGDGYQIYPYNNDDYEYGARAINLEGTNERVFGMDDVISIIGKENWDSYTKYKSDENRQSFRFLPFKSKKKIPLDLNPQGKDLNPHGKKKFAGGGGLEDDGDIITFDDGLQFQEVSEIFAQNNWNNKDIYGINKKDQIESLIEREHELDRFSVFGTKIGYAKRKRFVDGGGVDEDGEVLVKSAKASNDNDVYNILNYKWKKYKIVNSRAFDLETPYNRGWIDEGISINVYLLKDIETNKYYWDSDYIEARKKIMNDGGGVEERLVGSFYYDSRKDKTFQIISVNKDKISIQYFDKTKKPIGNIEDLNKQDFEYYVSKGAWGKYKQPYFNDGGGVDEDGEWLSEALESLKEHTDDDSLTIDSSNNDNANVIGDSGEYTIYRNEDLAEQDAIEKVKEDLQENAEYFNEEWLMGHISAESFFENLFNEWNMGYATDIMTEDDSRYGNRLIAEMVEWGIMDSDEANSSDAEETANERIEDFVQALTEDQINQGNEGLTYYIDNFGKEDAMKVVVENNLIDMDSASKDAVNVDGIGHFLSSYDGNTIYLENNSVAFRTN